MESNRPIKYLLITIGVFIIFAIVIVGLIYHKFPLKSADDYKNFGVIVGLSLTGLTTVFAAMFSFINFSEQAKHSINIEKAKQKLSADIEALKGEISRQNEIIKSTLNTKTEAFKALFTASGLCYRELQKLAKGQYNKKMVDTYETELVRADSLAADLDITVKGLSERILQIVMNIIDATDKIEVLDSNKLHKYLQIWNTNAKEFGVLIEKLHECSIHSKIHIS